MADLLSTINNKIVSANSSLYNPKQSYVTSLATPSNPSGTPAMSYAGQPSSNVPQSNMSVNPASSNSSVGKNLSSLSTQSIQQLVGAAVDGDYGPETTAKVKAWQSAHGLLADGIVGEKTMAETQKYMGGTSTLS